MSEGHFITKAQFDDEYRSFKKGAVLEFRPGINLLVGDQGCGKSSLLKAIVNYGDRNRIGEGPTFTTNGKFSFMFFDTEMNNPRVMELASQGADTYSSSLMSRFVSHGQTIAPIILHARSMKDRLILLDEPESGLSIRSQIEVGNALKEAASNGCQVIVATHSIKIMESVDEVLSLEHMEWMDTQWFIKSNYLPFGMK